MFPLYAAHLQTTDISQTLDYWFVKQLVCETFSSSSPTRRMVFGYLFIIHTFAICGSLTSTKLV